MKQISFFIPLLGTLLLSGCAGTSTEFECNATTSDTCMTMEQANEKAKNWSGPQKQSRLRHHCRAAEGTSGQCRCRPSPRPLRPAADLR
ncbi:hypothetical protein BANRA_04886 [Escherichia coli]|nr:type IV conjugative transfer system lipoprotein TraV [Escherichia coli]VCV70570.1 hypothetical protein BANRA_04886 [Escherichia coli]